jgi:hypothetical protein
MKRDECNLLIKQVSALLAVVELHKPEKRYRGETLYCSVCYIEGQPYERADDVYYPCPTIQAIEKELA